MATKLAGARVNEADYLAARRVFESEGFTVSQAIQLLMATTAQSGKIPSYLTDSSQSNTKKETFHALMDRVASRPSILWSSHLSDDDMRDQELLKRYG